MASPCGPQGKPKTGPPKVRPLGKWAQRGHSPIEEAIYWFLWSKSGSNPKDRIRKVDGQKVGGYKSVGQEVGASRSTVKKAIRSLQVKYSLELIRGSWNAKQRRGASYLIYSRQEIISRREAAGLTHYVRNRGGVTLTRAPVNSEESPAGCTEPLDQGAQNSMGWVHRDPSPGASEPPAQGLQNSQKLGMYRQSNPHSSSGERADSGPAEANELAHYEDDFSGKCQTIRDALISFVERQRLGPLAGKMPDETICAQIDVTGATVDDLIHFLNDEYPQRWTSPPATWKHVQVSVRNWLVDFRRPQAKSVSRDSRSARDAAYQEWKTEDKRA